MHLDKTPALIWQKNVQAIKEDSNPQTKPQIVTFRDDHVDVKS